MGQISEYYQYLKPHRKQFLVGIAASLLFGIASGAGLPGALKYVFQHVFEDQETQYALSQIVGIGLLLVLTFAIRGVFGFIGGYYLSYCGLQISIGIQKAIFDKLQTLPVAFFDKSQTGDIIARINNDSREIQKLVLGVASETIKQPAQMVFGIGYLVYLSLQSNETLSILLFFLSVPLFILPVKLIGRHLKKRGREVMDSYGKITQHLTENLGGILEIRSFNLEKKEKDQFHENLDENAMLNLKLKKYELTQQPSMEIISACVIAFVFIYAYQKNIEFSTFSALAMGLYLTFDPIKRIAKMVNMVHRTEGARNRISELLNTPNDITDPENPTPVDRLEGAITFNQVSFAYEDSDKSALKNVSLNIKPQSVIALVGKSGAGKSTFAKLICRFYEVSQGGISIDGIDLKNMSQADLRRNIAVVSQHPILFDDTLYNNIALGNPDATEQAIKFAAEKAYAHEFIEKLENKYETLAGERGERLSGGQRQRIAIARAFVKDAPILVLDEATSALDAESSKYIQLALENLIQNKTVFIIAHHLQTIKKADTILVFDQGQIVEQGTHENLYEQNGVYRELYDKQNQ